MASSAVTLSYTVVAKPTRLLSSPCLVSRPCRLIQTHRFRGARLVSVAAVPETESLSEKVSESIKNAEEACAGDPVSGECAAAWDEVEEMSAAASDARLKKKESDPLENYCKEFPETDECRTHDN